MELFVVTPDLFIECTNPECALAGELQPAANFHKASTTTRGYQYWCRVCTAERDRRLWSAKSGAVYAPPSGQSRRWVHLKHRYKMDRTDWEVRFIAQRGLCAGGCGGVPTQVDHDHSCCPTYPTCGQCVRGLVCNKCNSRDVLAA